LSDLLLLSQPLWSRHGQIGVATLVDDMGSPGRSGGTRG